MSSGDFVHEERVRFRDLDPMGHVNNAVFLTYLEQARVAFFSAMGAATGLDLVGPVTLFGAVPDPAMLDAFAGAGVD